MNKQIFKKWWFWLIVIIVLSAIGAAAQFSSETTTTNSPSGTEQAVDASTTGTLPKLTESDYLNKEGLVVYKDMKAKGYAVDADFKNQALTDINGKASTMFEQMDASKMEDRQSVDSFVVGSMTQNGDSIKLIIVKSAN